MRNNRVRPLPNIANGRAGEFRRIKFETRERRGGRRSRVFFANDRSLGDRIWWLAQQCRWPPALPVFPANREFYRDFTKSRALGAPETANNGVTTGLAVRIPIQRNREKVFGQQGTSGREQGIPLGIFFRMHSEWRSAEVSRGNATSSHTPETMATTVGSARIWRGGDRVVFTLVGSINFPSPRRAAVCPLYWDAWGLRGHCRLDFRQMVARLCANLQAKQRSASRRCHWLTGTTALCTSICNSICFDPTDH